MLIMARIETSLGPNGLVLTSDFNNEKEDIFTSITQVAEAGFNVMFCHEWDTDKIIPKDEIKSIGQLLKEREIRMVDIHGSEGKKDYWLSEVSDTRKAGIELVRNRIEMASILGAGTVVMHIPSEKDEGFSWGVVDNAINSLMPSLEKYNITLAFENLFGKEKNGKIIHENTDTLVNIFKKYKTPRIGMCLDSGHQNMTGGGYSQDSPINQFKDRIVALHLHDNDGKADEHKIPRTGTVNWDGLTKFLANSSYATKPLVFENALKNHEGMTIGDFLTRTHIEGLHLAGQRNNIVNLNESRAINYRKGI